MEDQKTTYVYDTTKPVNKVARLAAAGFAGLVLSVTGAAAAVTALQPRAATPQAQPTAQGPTSSIQSSSGSRIASLTPANFLGSTPQVDILQIPASQFNQQLDFNQIQPEYGSLSSSTPTNSVGSGSWSQSSESDDDHDDDDHDDDDDDHDDD